MTPEAELPAWAALLAAMFVLLGAGLALTGSLGLLRLRRFYEQVHAPTLGTTLGTASVSIASMVYFSALQTRPVVHEVLIAVFVTLTTPVTLMLLVRAAVFRDRAEGTLRDFDPHAASDDPGAKPAGAGGKASSGGSEKPATTATRR